MASLEDTDKFLVNRSTSSYHIEAQNIMADLQDDDLMLVQRDGLSYKATGADIKESLKPNESPTVVVDVTLVEDDTEGPRFNGQSFTTTTLVVDGNPVGVKTFDAHVDGTLSKNVQFEEPLESSETVTKIIESSDFTSSNGWLYPPENMFDDDLLNTCQTNASSGASVRTFTWDLSNYPLTGVLECIISCIGSTPNWTIDITHKDGVHTEADVNPYYDLPLAEGIYNSIYIHAYTAPTLKDITSFKITAAPSDRRIEILGWRLNGIYLESNIQETELVFAAGADMEPLAAGDAVTQVESAFEEPLQGSNEGAAIIYSDFLIPEGRWANTAYDAPKAFGMGGGFDGTGTGVPGSLPNNYAQTNDSSFVYFDCSQFPLSGNIKMSTYGTAGQNALLFKITHDGGTDDLGRLIGVGSPNLYVHDLGTYSNVTRIEILSDAGVSYIAVRGFRVDDVDLFDGDIRTNLVFADGTAMGQLAGGDTVIQGSTFGTVGSIEDTTVTLSSFTGDWVDGVNVTGPTKEPSGIVSSITDTTVTLSSSTGGWTIGEDVIGPEKVVVEDNARLYCKFDNSGNVIDLINNPQDPPYTTTDTNPELTLTFPATFPSGNTPDEELPFRTTLTVDVTAENDVGISGPVSATVQPGGDTLQFNEPLVSSTNITGGSLDDVRLTFANGTDMSTLEANDTVTQTRNFTEPLESNTSVTGLVYSNFMYGDWDYPAPQEPNTEADKAFGAGAGFDSTSTARGAMASGKGGTVITFNCSTFPITGELIWVESYAGASFEITKDGGETYTEAPAAITIDSFNIHYVLTLDNVVQIKEDRIRSGGRPSCRGISVNGTVLLDNAISQELTFANGTDMSQLLPGDVVTGNTDGSTVETLSVTSTPPTAVVTGGTWVNGQDVTTGNLVTSGTVDKIVNTSVDIFNSTGSWVNQQNVIGPDKTPIRSQTSDEFNETNAKFLTYDNRRDIYEGTQAHEAKDAVIAAAESAGVTARTLEDLYN